jgi:hypothetical protein
MSRHIPAAVVLLAPLALTAAEPPPALASNCPGTDTFYPFPDASIGTADGRALCGPPNCSIVWSHDAPLGGPLFDFDYWQVRMADKWFDCGTTGSDSKLTWNNVNMPTFKLHPAQSCSALANLGPALAEVTVKGVLTGQPTGVLRAAENPCDRGNPLGCTTIFWDTKEVDEPRVQIMVAATSQIFQCPLANEPDSASTWTGLNKATLKLQVVDGCTDFASCCMAVAPSLVTPLAELTVIGADSLPVCSRDGKTMTQVKPEFFGIIGNELFQTVEPARAAEKMKEAGVTYMRSNIRWFRVQPYDPAEHTYPDGEFNFGSYDVLFSSFVSEGIEPWVTLLQTPLWASPIERGVNGPPESCQEPCPEGEDCYPTSPVCCQFCSNGFPCEGFCRFAPTDIETWKDYVRAVVERYGTGQTIDGGPYGPQVIKIDNWDIWLEPDNSLQAAPGQPAGEWIDDYIELLAAAYEVIDEIRDRPVDGNPDLKIWGPDVIFYHPDLDEPGGRCFRDLARAVLAETKVHGYLDGLSVHLFHEDLEGMVQGYRLMRALVDQYVPNLPIAVTAIQHWAENQCPYSNDPTGEIRAQAINDHYVCLANEGATHVFWYKSTERVRPECPGGIEKSGVLTPWDEFPNGYQPNSAYDEFKAIGDFIAATQP